MTNEQINLVKTSFEKVAPVAEKTAALFYEKLFEIDPNLRHLFKGDINEQGRKLMQMIGLAVKGLDRIDELVPAVQSLGARHTGYGVKEHHYETVATALLWTLENVLGEEFTTKTKDAWTAVYILLVQTMQTSKVQTAEDLAVAV